MSPITGLLPGRPAESLRPRLRRDRHDPAGRTSQIHRNPRTTNGERTLEHYRGTLERHVLPRLGHRRLQLITTDDLAALVAELRAKGLSPWTINGLLVPLSCVFSFAVRRSYIATNPLRHLHPDERPHPRLSDQRVLTRAELARLLHATPPRYQPLLATAIATGMRFSEVLALSWADVDFAAGVIHVRYQLARGRRGLPPRRVAPKTRASVREIPLLPQLAAVLRQHKSHSRYTDAAPAPSTTAASPEAAIADSVSTTAATRSPAT